MSRHLQNVFPRRCAILICAVGATALVGILTFAFWPGPKEPEYQGKKLSAWADLYISVPPADLQLQAQTAIRHIGTNAVPFFVTWVASVEPAWKSNLFLRINRISPGFAARLRGSSHKSWLWGIGGFRILGPQGAPGVPKLAALARESPSGEIRHRAMDALYNIGDPALPEMINIMTNRTIPERWTLVGRFSYTNGFSSNVVSIVPALVQCLDETTRDVIAAMAALRALCARPDIVVPAIVPKLEDPDPGIRKWAVGVLDAYGEAAQPAIPALLAALNDPYLTMIASNAIVRIVPEVLQTNRMREVHE